MAQVSVEQAFQSAFRHQQAGELQQAERLYRQILAQQPNHADALLNLGVLAFHAGRHDAAAQLMRRASALKPNAPEAYSNLGAVLRAQGLWDEAISAYRQAIALKPDFPAAHDNLGVALQARGRLDEAVAAYRGAIALAPDFAAAHNNLGNALGEQEQFEAAIEAYRAAIGVKGDFAQAYSNLGNALTSTGRFEEAVAACERSVALDPQQAEAHNNLGSALKMAGRMEQALAAYRRAIRVRPDYRQAHYNLARALLLKGEFAEGWVEYEWRWHCRGFVPSVHMTSHPRWDGAELPGKTILVHAEQGLGDALQFIRFAPLVARRGLRVIVEAPATLALLLAGVEGVAEVVATGAALPPFDVQIPMLSLPLVLGTNLSTIGAKAPYLRADEQRAKLWAQKLGAARGVKVGLCWAGHPWHENDRWRSVRLDVLGVLGEVPGVTFVSLQKGVGSEQTAGSGLKLLDWTGEIRDFGDTAALVSRLDLIISVDTAVVHLAGALGKPVWTLLAFVPGQFWLLERADSPWYPTMRLFRQARPNDWGQVVGDVARALAGLGRTASR